MTLTQHLTFPPNWRWLVRVVGAGLLAATAGIHLHLLDQGYADIPTIGEMFLLNGVLGILLTVAVLLTPRRWLGVTSAVGALLQIGTLGALVLSLTVGLAGLNETLQARLVIETIAVESAGFLVLAGYAAYDIPRSGR